MGRGHDAAACAGCTRGEGLHLLAGPEAELWAKDSRHGTQNRRATATARPPGCRPAATRRWSAPKLAEISRLQQHQGLMLVAPDLARICCRLQQDSPELFTDRKSTRLNSSH